MKLVSVVCRVIEDGDIEHLHNVEPATFMDLLSAAVEGDPEQEDLAALEAELAASKPAAQPVIQPAPAPAPSVRMVDNEVVLPHEAFDPIASSKTRGELFERVNELLSQFNTRIAKAGE